MKEGIPRYILKTGYSEIEGKSMFRQERNYDDKAEYLYDPRVLPIKAQLKIGSAMDIDITKSLVGLYRYSIDMYFESDRRRDIRNAFDDLRGILTPMESFPGQNHKEIVTELVNHMSDIALSKNRIGRIANIAIAYGTIVPFYFFNHMKKPTRSQYLNIIGEPFNYRFEELPDQQKEIVSTAGLFTGWEALNGMRVEGFTGPNPFKPYLDVIENGSVGIFIDEDDAKQTYSTRPYSEEPVEDIGLLVAA